jgi:hypothetical protein
MAQRLRPMDALGSLECATVPMFSSCARSKRNRLHSDALENRGVTSHRAAPHDAGDV